MLNIDINHSNIAPDLYDLYNTHKSNDNRFNAELYLVLHDYIENIPNQYNLPIMPYDNNLHFQLKLHPCDNFDDVILYLTTYVVEYNKWYIDDYKVNILPLIELKQAYEYIIDTINLHNIEDYFYLENILKGIDITKYDKDLHSTLNYIIKLNLYNLNQDEYNAIIKLLVLYYEVK